MSTAVKILVPLVLIGALVWLFTMKYPAMANPTQSKVAAKEEVVPPTSDIQLEKDLATIDADVKAALEASASAEASFSDTPVSLSE